MTTATRIRKTTFVVRDLVGKSRLVATDGSLKGIAVVDLISKDAVGFKATVFLKARVLVLEEIDDFGRSMGVVHRLHLDPGSDIWSEVNTTE